MQISKQNLVWRPSGALVIASLTLPTLLAGCGGSPAPQSQSMAPPSQSMAPQRAPQVNQPKAGMTTKQKVTLLVGAAAMYYLYRKYQRDNASKLQQVQAQAPGGKIQYYRSKSKGFIYYRDPQSHQAIIVAPGPSEVGTLNVPDQQAQEVSNFQGYNNATGGETLDKYFPVQ